MGSTGASPAYHAAGGAADVLSLYSRCAHHVLWRRCSADQRSAATATPSGNTVQGTLVQRSVYSSPQPGQLALRKTPFEDRLMKSHSTGPFGFRVAEPFLLSQHGIFMSPRVAFGPLKSPLIASTTHQITHQRGDWLANPGPFTSPTSLAKWGRGRCASFLTAPCFLGCPDAESSCPSCLGMLPEAA